MKRLLAFVFALAVANPAHAFWGVGDITFDFAKNGVTMTSMTIERGLPIGSYGDDGRSTQQASREERFVAHFRCEVFGSHEASGSNARAVTVAYERDARLGSESRGERDGDRRSIRTAESGATDSDRHHPRRQVERASHCGAPGPSATE